MDFAVHPTIPQARCPLSLGEESVAGARGRIGIRQPLTDDILKNTVLQQRLGDPNLGPIPPAYHLAKPPAAQKFQHPALTKPPIRAKGLAGFQTFGQIAWCLAQIFMFYS